MREKSSIDEFDKPTNPKFVTFLEIVDTMDVPEGRKANDLGSLSWMQRNIGIRNSNHPRYEEVMELVKDLLKEARERVNNLVGRK